MMQRIQKALAAAGYGSRRQIEDLISAGRVQLNGQDAILGDKVGVGDKIKIDGIIAKIILTPQRRRVILLNKPLGVVCSKKDHKRRPLVWDYLPNFAKNWVQVGRLDINTSGLLLFTNDGDYANFLMHPSSEVEREYIVRVRLPHEAVQKIGSLVNPGVMIDKTGRPAKFKHVRPFSAKRESSGSNKHYSVVIGEGRNREVRKMFEAIGGSVNRLTRMRYGDVILPKSMELGTWVEV